MATALEKSPSLYRQTKQALEIIDSSLAEASSDKAHILQATVYITDMTQKPEMNRAWEEWGDHTHPPMRACVGVALERDDLVEVVVVAALRRDS